MNSGLTEQGKSIVPSAYLVNSIKLTNHKGETFDIQHLITEFSIKESIYSPTLIASFSVKDATNLIEFHSLIGQERITIDITKTDEDNIKELKLSFIVTEYPLYSKQSNDQLQVFTFSAISEHAYLSRISKISRAYDGNTTDIIQKILINDCKIPEENLNITQSNTACKGIYPYQQPLQVVKKLLNISSNDVQSPYYMFETLDGKMNVLPLSEMLSQTPFDNYIKAKEFKANPMGKEDFNERRKKILSITSDLKLGTVFQMAEGAYASETNTLDIATKTYKQTSYKYTEHMKASESNNLSDSFTVDEKPLTDYTKSYQEHISQNSLSFNEDTKQNINTERSKHGSLIRAHNELLDTLTHDISLYGDLDLTAGTLVTLTLPKAISPDSKKTLGYSPQESTDEYLSGDYLIASTKHTFRNGKYSITARVKKDTLNYG
jgi:hypothetical protein